MLRKAILLGVAMAMLVIPAQAINTVTMSPELRQMFDNTSPVEGIPTRDCAGLFEAAKRFKIDVMGAFHRNKVEEALIRRIYETTTTEEILDLINGEPALTKQNADTLYEFISDVYILVPFFETSVDLCSA